MNAANDARIRPNPVSFPKPRGVNDRDIVLSKQKQDRKRIAYAYRTLLLCTGGGMGTLPFGACGLGCHGADAPFGGGGPCGGG